jgi:DMSO/TMAO reductase YedYZ molybdopterin-dependent catalytic subunit
MVRSDPRLPPGQVETKKWPVLTYGPTPIVEKEAYRLRVFGLVAEEKSFTWDDLMSLPVTELVTPMHCVTRWSNFENRWVGIRFTDILAIVKPLPDARFVVEHSYGGYTTNVSLEDLRSDDVLLVHTWNGAPLSREHGFPLRMLVPKLYLWKSAKWLNALEFLARDRPGFWERNGYHNHGDPWAEERHG